MRNRAIFKKQHGIMGLSLYRPHLMCCHCHLLQGGGGGGGGGDMEIQYQHKSQQFLNTHNSYSTFLFTTWRYASHPDFVLVRKRLTCRYSGKLFIRCKVCSLLEWCFMISIEVTGDHSQIRCTGFAVNH